MGEVTAELLVDIDLPVQPVISPDGRWVAYAVAAMGRRAEREGGGIWVAAADGSVPPRRVTAGTARDRLPRWAPDSSWLFFVSDRGGSAQLYRVSPAGGEPEVLILHGENDTNVPVGQATYFHRALRNYGVEHEFVVYPREGHSIRERPHQVDLLQRTRAWFDRWLGPARPVGMSPPCSG